jgi:hypothetical protein
LLTVEDASAVEKRQSETKHLLELFLESEHQRPFVVRPATSARDYNVRHGDLQLIVDLRDPSAQLGLMAQGADADEDGRSCRPVLTSFSPNENTGTKSAPSLIAILMNPNRFLSVRSAVPGCADSDSAAPPTTMVMA